MRTFILILSITCLAIVAKAQDFPPPPPPEDEIPVDGGVGALLVAGAAWGIKKLKEKK